MSRTELMTYIKCHTECIFSILFCTSKTDSFLKMKLNKKPTLINRKVSCCWGYLLEQLVQQMLFATKMCIMHTCV